MSTITTATHRCTACETAAGERMSRHAVRDGWLTYYRCHSCRGISAIHTPRMAWTG